jgi:sigma-E factor negative regulatory protein RseB
VQLGRKTLFALLLLWAGTALADAAPGPANNNQTPSVGKLLTNAAQAVRLENYRGVLVYLHENQLDTLKVVHRYHHHVEQERLISLTGPPREVIRKGNQVTSILPRNKVVLISEHPSQSLLGRITRFSPARMKNHYVMHNAGQQRLAGRLCQVIRIEPKDRYRYGYHMLIDNKTQLPLKLELLNNGHVLEQMMFTQIAYPKSIPDSVFLPDYDVAGYRIVKHQAIHMEDPAVPEDHWHTKNLPPGFTLAEDGVRQVSQTVHVRQMLFTDGVSTVSAFIAPAGLRVPLRGASHMGAIHAYGRVADNTQITVVGEVPAITVKRIARNIVRTKNK